jgi:hypothetical protein
MSATMSMVAVCGLTLRAGSGIRGDTAISIGICKSAFSLHQEIRINTKEKYPPHCPGVKLGGRRSTYYCNFNAMM